MFKKSGWLNLVLLICLAILLQKKPSTTIRIKKQTKQKISNLDFVKKDTYDEILEKLIIFYEKRKSK